MTARQQFHHETNESGMSLVELIVTVVVSAIVLSVIAVLFGNALSAQQQATERDLATGRANVAALQVKEAIRESVSATLYTTFSNHLGMPQTQLNLTKVTPEGGLVCDVWIWEDRSDNTTILYHQGYRKYATEPIPGSSRVGSWKTDAGDGQHVTSSTGTGGLQPRDAHFTFNAGGLEGGTSVIVSGGGIVQGMIDTQGKDNPCRPGFPW